MDDKNVTSPPPPTSSPICVAALYQFTRFEDREAIRALLLALCERLGIKGTLLIAHEGINGTVAGTQAAIDALLAHIRTLPGCDRIEAKFSAAETMPFHRMKVRLKREIVTMGVDTIDPLTIVGTYVRAEEWNALISDPETIVIDTRNDYEVAAGTFAGAIDPHTRTFRDFPAWFRAERDKLLGEGKAPKVAMFCTGGIRCEKSTAFLKAEGVENVFHLEGGILKYLETVPEEASLWRGECFVFDQRVAVGHGLAPGTHELCHACRRPVSVAGRASPLYEPGVSCPACHDERTEEQRTRYRERYRQECLASERGTTHVGAMRPASDGADNRDDTGGGV
ncbi:rhodanese-related sulfurtransferase [Caenibius sp. WL]|uniref:oxygen-dependent tRNA uridine(34) hydroxylase TrhO n=1 Tax=Caenibius sp. WL TaxID=2872646 RepID=UPI001C994E76|nr:rhodanese-related sulfurtransferase [Caenibius sp. WL]QZP07489.1 rhodanese-related sulfurtransferase [Caenibius sp. WL]